MASRASTGSGSRAGSACSIPASTPSRSRPRFSRAACSCKSAELSVPANAQTPIAAEVVFASPEADGPLTASLDWRRSEGEEWTITVATADGRRCASRAAASRLLIDGQAQDDDGPGEYPDIYRQFVDLIDERAQPGRRRAAAAGRRLPAGREPQDRRAHQQLMEQVRAAGHYPSDGAAVEQACGRGTREFDRWQRWR